MFLCLLGIKWSGRLQSPPAAAICIFCVPRVRPELTPKVSMQARFTPMAHYQETEEEPPIEAKVEKPSPHPRGMRCWCSSLTYHHGCPPTHGGRSSTCARSSQSPRTWYSLFEWAKLRRESGAQPIFFLVALALYTSPSPPNRDTSLMEIYMTVTHHLTDYDPVSSCKVDI
jgi:hypothetical protein